MHNAEATTVTAARYAFDDVGGVLKLSPTLLERYLGTRGGSRLDYLG
jgi:hypothetical protein